MKKTIALFILLWLSHAIIAQPNDFNYYKSLGIVQYYEKDFLQSIFNFQKAASLKPSDKDVANFLRMCYDSVGSKDLAGKMRMKMEKFGKADDTRPLIKPAMLSEEMRSSDPAKNSRSPIRRPASSSSDAAHDLRQLGDFFMDRESYDSAYICYKHYMDLYPKDTPMRFYLATSQYFTKRYDEAVGNYQIAVNNEPRRAELYNWIGVCELLRGNYLAARDNFRQCIKIDQDYTLAYFNLGKTEYELEDYGDAQKNLEKALELMPNDPDVMKILADIYYNTSKWDKAAAMYEVLYPDNRKSERINYRLGDTYIRLSQWSKAITYLSNLLELTPNNLDARKKLAIADYNTEKYAAAVENFDKVSKTLWDDKELMLYAAISANKLGDYTKAQEYAERAITLDKNYLRAYYQLANAYKGEGKKKEYKETLAKTKDMEMNAVGNAESK